MTVPQVILMSIVEGLTEFLPVSSTAHLVLTAQILRIAQSDFVKSFEVMIQLGAILAVVVLYYGELKGNVQLWYKTILAFLPSTVLGFLFYDIIKEKLIGNGIVTACALIIGGIIFIVIDSLTVKNSFETSPAPGNIDNPKLFVPRQNSNTNSIETIHAPKLLMIGVFQCLAMVPGVSRSAASIFGGVLMGLNKNEAVKFSFFLAIPTMLAASALDLYRSDLKFTPDEIQLLLLGLAGAFITALIAIKTFVSFVQKHSFLPFGIYRIVTGIIWLFAIL